MEYRYRVYILLGLITYAIAVGAYVGIMVVGKLNDNQVIGGTILIVLIGVVLIYLMQEAKNRIRDRS